MSQAMLIEDVVVPRPNELRVMKMMRTTRTKNHARFALAALALIRLHHRIGDGKHTGLFAPITGVKETKQISTEGKATAWQSAFLDRLEERGLIKSETPEFNTNIYSVPLDRRDEFARIAASPFVGDGAELKRLLWPGDYADAEEPESAEPNHAEPAPVEGESQVLTALTETLSSLVQTMTATLQSVAPLQASMVELEKRIGAKVDEVHKAVASMQAVAKSFNDAADRFDTLSKKLDDEDRRNVATIAAKITELSGRAKSVSNQLDAVVAKEAELLSQLTATLEKRKP